MKSPSVLSYCWLIAVASSWFYCGCNSRESDSTTSIADIRRLVQQGQLSHALKSTQAWSDGGRSNAAASLLKAECYRQLGMKKEFEECLASAKKSNASATEIAILEELFRTQQGDFENLPEAQCRYLEKNGAAAESAAAAVAIGSIASRRNQYVRPIVDELLKKSANSEIGNWLSSKLLLAEGKPSLAVSQLRQVISLNPNFELAWLALADCFAEINSSKESLVLEQIVSRFPDNPVAVSRRIQSMRRIGLSTQASTMLDTSMVAKSNSETMESIELDLDRGRFDLASGKLESMGLSKSDGFRDEVDRAFRDILAGKGADSDEIMRSVQVAAIAFGLNEMPDAANELVSLRMDRVSRIRRIADLRSMDRIAPNVPQIQSMLKNAEDLSTPLVGVKPLKRKRSTTDSASPSDPELETGREIYRLQCAQCHGEAGDGLGLAARHLWPAPRNLVGEPMRYVSSKNAMATDDDLKSTIRLGLHGVSMPAFPKLTDTELVSVVKHIRSLQREELIKRFRASHIGDEDESNLEEWLASKMQAGETLRLETIPPSSDPSIALGEQLFETLNCQQCHRHTDSGQSRRMTDSLGRTILARDLIAEPLRKGDTFESVAARVVAGMPGTPHPATTDLAPNQIAAIVHFVKSLSTKDKLTTTNHQRSRLAD